MASKKIKTSELRLGMFLVRLDAPWMSTPFWRTRFLLEKAEDLHAAMASGLDACWIDPARGRDVDPPASPAPASLSASEPAAAAPVHVRGAEPAELPRTFVAELETARSVCISARDTIAAVFEQARMGRAIDHGACALVVGDIMGSVARHPLALLSLARLKSDDDYTYMHSVAVCALMVALARSMRLPAAQVREAGLGGLLHDVGKADIPLAILNKPAALDEHEFATVKRHPELGYHNLARGSASEPVREVILYHHERMDGKGYPSGRVGAATPLLARMGAVCDVYDAITSDRPYKKGWDPAAALSQMISWSGHFDPKVLSAFIEVVGIYPVGALVRLKSQRVGVVVEQNGKQLTRPHVRAFYCLTTRRTLAPVLVDLALETDEAILGSEEKGAWPQELVEAMWSAPRS